MKTPVTLDAKISVALADKTASRETLVSLWQEALDTIEKERESAAAESKRVYDLSNADPDMSEDRARRAQRTIDRLSHAIPLLKQRVTVLDAEAYAKTWHAEVDKIKIERDALADELAALYPTFVAKIADLFARIDQNTAAISDLHGKAFAGEERRLADAEQMARNVAAYTAEQPRLRENLRLPDWERPRDIAYPAPPAVNPYAAHMQTIIAEIARKEALTSGPNWHEAKKLEDEATRAEIAKREAELAAQAAEAKRHFERQVQADDRRRRGLVD